MSIFKTSRLVYFSHGPEGSHDVDNSHLAEGMAKHADRPDDGMLKKEDDGHFNESVKVEGGVDYKGAAETAITRATVEAQNKGQNLIDKAKAILKNTKYMSEREKPQGEITVEQAKAVIGYQEKLEQDVWRQERIEIRDMFKGSSVHTANEDTTVTDFLTHPSVARDLGLDHLVDFHGIYPALDKTVIRRGEHLVLSKDKKSIRVVHLADRAADMPLMDISQIVTDDKKDVADRSEKGLQKSIDSKNGYTLLAGNRVKFLNKKALKDMTIGKMEQFKGKEALMVNGKLTIKGSDGEFYGVTEKNGTYALAPKRAKVLNGTRISTEVPQDTLAKVMNSIKPSQPTATVKDGTLD